VFLIPISCLSLGFRPGNNYHLGQLEGFIEKSAERNYVLTPLGRKAVDLFGAMAQKSESDYGQYLKTAKFAQRSSLPSLIRSLIYGLTAWGVLIVGVWCYLLYIMITEGAPLIVYVVLPALIALGIAMLGWLIYALRIAPEVFKRLERRLISPS